MTTGTIRMPQASGSPLWTAARIAGLLLTVLLLIALGLRPEVTLPILWDMVIPLLPAGFLANPVIWRNVCPLATLNGLTGKRRGRLIPGRGLVRGSWVAGLVLLWVLVPARRFLFNENGLALLITIAGVGGLALAAGLVFSRRAGFCNALCPVLPVEKLYGQAPLLRVPTSRCTDCNLCSPIGCPELAGGKSLAQSFGPARHGRTWCLSPLGVFAGSFPGFVLGYFTTANGPVSSAFDTYLHIGTWAFLSFGLTATVVMGLDLRPGRTLPVLGAAAVGLYYWFAGPTIATAYGLPDPASWFVRVAAAALISVWLVKALGRGVLPRRPSPINGI